MPVSTAFSCNSTHFNTVLLQFVVFLVPEVEPSSDKTVSNQLVASPLRQRSSAICTFTTRPPQAGWSFLPQQPASRLHPATDMDLPQRGADSMCMAATARRVIISRKKPITNDKWVGKAVKLQIRRGGNSKDGGVDSSLLS